MDWDNGKFCINFVVEKLYFVNLLDFIWTWTSNFYKILDFGWTWPEV